MGKQGPCYHCGVTSTPLWRNGPPEKPVLCNACGSRWRTKGTLANYTPLHSRADAEEYEDRKVPKVKAISFKLGGEKLKKRKLCYENSGWKRLDDEDTSNRSSSGSALTSADVSEFTSPFQLAVWENQVLSKKRTSMIRTESSSPVEKLIKDLHAILHEQKSSYLCGSSEEDLLFASDAPMVSVEIGHGSVLIEHPSWLVKQEDSEASSLSFENKPCSSNEAYSHPASLSGSNGFKGGNVVSFARKVMQEPVKRDKSSHDKMKHSLAHTSPLCFIDLKDVINFEVLLGHFTRDELQQLLKYLPPGDASELPGSLRNMFDSSCFKENMSFFQQLLSDGDFSNGYSGAKAEDLKALKKLLVSNSTKSKMLGLEVESGSKQRPLEEQNLNMPLACFVHELEVKNRFSSGKKTTEGWKEESPSPV